VTFRAKLDAFEGDLRAGSLPYDVPSEATA
jgi:hypothetical protein